MECSICYESKEKMGVTDPCGHVFCFECHEKIQEDDFMRERCSICKGRFYKLIRVFSSNPDSTAADKLSCAVFEMEEAAAKLAEVKEDLSKGLGSIMEKRKHARAEYDEIKAKSKEISAKIKADTLKKIEVEILFLRGHESVLRDSIEKQTLKLEDIQGRIVKEENYYLNRKKETDDLIKKLRSINEEITPAQKAKLNHVAALEKKIEVIKKNKHKIVEDFRKIATTMAYEEVTTARREKQAIEDEIKAVCVGHRSFKKCKEMIEDARKLRDFVKTGRLKGANKEIRELMDRIADF